MFKYFTIGTKIIGGFLLVALIPLIIVSFISFTTAQSSLKNHEIESVVTLLDLKAEKIETFFKTLRADIRIAEDYLNVKTNLPIVTYFADNKTHLSYIQAKSALDTQLKTFQRVKGFKNIMLIGTEGDIVYVTDEEHRAINISSPLFDPENKAFKEGKKAIYFSDPFIDTREGEDHFDMLVSAPVRDLEGEFIGVIAFEIEMDSVYEFLHNTVKPGQTGETLIGRDEGSYVLFLSPLLHDPDAALKRKVSFGERDAFPIQEAVQGKNGFGISIDYREEEVIAAWRYLPLLNWGMVVKVDTKEAFAGTVRLRNDILLISSALLLISLLLSFYISYSLSKPIIILRDAVLKIEKGDFNQRVEVNSKDEIGQLGVAFNKMAVTLKRSYKDTNKNVEETIRGMEKR